MNANEPAFPLEFSSPSSGPERYYGLTKREHFAGLAMQAWIADNSRLDDCQGAAQWAVMYADALLAELASTKPKDSQ